MKINWKVRFSKNNLTFIIRFIAALMIPIFAYMELEWRDLTTWSKLGETLVDFVSNPYLVGLVIINGINLLPDPTTKGLSDSERALQYRKPGGKL